MLEGWRSKIAIGIMILWMMGSPCRFEMSLIYTGKRPTVQDTLLLLMDTNQDADRHISSVNRSVFR